MFLHQAKRSEQLWVAISKVFTYLQREFNNRGVTLLSNEYIKAGEQEIVAFPLLEREQNIKHQFKK